MKLRGFDITNAQRGWVCDCCFMVSTANQYAAEEHAVRGHGRWIWLAMYRSYRIAKKTHAKMRAKAGERAALGWAD